MKRNIQNLLFSAAFLLCCLTASAVDTQQPTGDGSQANPYQIATADNLVWFAEHVNSGNTSACAILTEDITVNTGVLDSNGDLNGTPSNIWTPIGGQNGKDYSGEFDGNGHTISGLYFNDESVNNIGLFGKAVGNAHIHDLGIKDSYFYGKDHVGGICGDFASGRIENCWSEVTVYVATGDGGGLTGSVYINAVLTNCYSICNVSGNGSRGLVCGAFYGTIENCYAQNRNSTGTTSLIGWTSEEGPHTATNVEIKDAAAFASGEVCWLLNSGVTDGTQKWYQTLGGTDNFPVLDNSHGTVYYGYDGNVLTYSNSPLVDPSNKASYIDANGNLQVADNVTEITNSSSTLNAGWYVVTGADVQTGSLTCNGEVHLILADGAKLTATESGGSYNPGIRVSGTGNSLAIYGQSAQSGQLIATGGGYSAGIGGGKEQTGSNITIYGGEITASGGLFGAGIGSGDDGSSASNIKVATNLLVKAGSSENPTTVITNTGADLASQLAGKRYVTVGSQKHAVTYGEHITVSPEFASGANVACGTTITFTAADRSANGYEFVGFYKESTFDTPITEGVSGQTCTATVTDAAISVYAKYLQHVSVAYIDADGQPQNATDAIVVTSATSQDVWNAGWYVVNGSNVTLSKGAVCNGEVHLILADGAQLTATGISDGLSQTFTSGILVSGTGNSLTIYGQTAQSGRLTANGGSSSAGIGGCYLENKDASNITINGGVITANGSYGAAGIGGGNGGDGSNITVNQGKVTASGGEYASAIGGGWQGNGSNIFIATTLFVKADNNNPPATTITNTDTNLAGSLAGKRYAAIEPIIVTYGEYITVSPEFESGSNVAYGTGVTFTAADRSADEYGFIGFYKESTFDTPITQGVSGRTCTLTVNEAAMSVYAKYRQQTLYVDADGSKKLVDAAEITSNTLSAGWYVVRGSDENHEPLTCNGAVHLILADGAKLTAQGGTDQAGITVSGEGNSLTIYGQIAQSGQLIANGGKHAAGIGGGYYGPGSHITINGGTVIATGGEDGAGIGGGGYAGSGSYITITGGVVTATGGENGAGIGGGADGSGSYITITGGVVTATGGKQGAGIGGGSEGSGSYITITGGDVTANGGQGASCIGKGHDVWGVYYCSNIFVATELILRADNNNPPTTVVAADRTNSTDIAGALNGKRYATVRIPQGGIVTYGEYITVSPQFASGDRVAAETEVTFTAADRFADNYEFIGFYKESTFENKITNGVSGLTYTATVLDDNISVYAKYEEFIPTPYIDANGQEQSVKATEITNETSTLSAGWYVVAGNDVQTGTLTCNGEVHLILADGAKLTAQGGEHQAGITVSGNGNSLTIYGQAAQSGQLIANGGYYGAGIGGGKEQSGSNITINGGEVTATGGRDGAGIGRGGGDDVSGWSIKVATALTVYADNTNPPTTEISHTDNDIASHIAVFRYVIVKDVTTGIKDSAIAAINAAIEGVTNEDIIAIATNAIDAINAATSADVINAIKEQALADIASALAAYNSAFGEMGTPCDDCPAVEVTKGTKTIRLYNPDKVEFKKE